MNVTNYSETVNIPTVEEFATVYTHYRNLVCDDFKFLFDLIMTPASFVAARVVTDELGLPAVAGIAAQCTTAVHAKTGNTPTRQMNQFIGSVVSCLMQANGYAKTGTKRAIPHASFSRGEVYMREI